MNTICLYPTQKPPTTLEILQAEFAILELQGKHAVIRHSDLVWKPEMKMAPQLRLYQGADANLVLRRRIETISSTSNTKVVISDFFNSPLTPLYKHVTFSPLPQPMIRLIFGLGAP